MGIVKTRGGSRALHVSLSSVLIHFRGSCHGRRRPWEEGPRDSSSHSVACLPRRLDCVHLGGLLRQEGIEVRPCLSVGRYCSRHDTLYCMLCGCHLRDTTVVHIRESTLGLFEVTDPRGGQPVCRRDFLLNDLRDHGPKLVTDTRVEGADDLVECSQRRARGRVVSRRGDGGHSWFHRGAES